MRLGKLQSDLLRQRRGRRTKQNGAARPMEGRIAPTFVLRICEKCGHTEWWCGYHFRAKPVGFPKGAMPPFGTQPLEQRCSVLYLLPRLTGKTSVSHDGHTCFTRQESEQIFVNGSEQKAGRFQRVATGIQALVPRLSLERCPLFRQGISTGPKADTVPITVLLLLQDEFAVICEPAFVFACAFPCVSRPDTR